ncbi:MAG TPA: MFS transporter [Trebonia sp.]
MFAAASLASALAPSSGVMIGTRAVEGLAAAFVVPMTLAMLSSVFPPGPARNRAFSVWGGVSAAAGTLGLILGGALVSAGGWRWIFLVNVPAAAGHSAPVALTTGFHAGFAVSVALMAVGVITAVALLREEGRGERINLVELRAGE